MIGTEFIKGQGLGNQLFCYISSRCIAEDLGYEFGIAGADNLGINIHSNQGMNFFEFDSHTVIHNKEEYTLKKEKDVRHYTSKSCHDYRNGCYVAGFDASIYHIHDNTLIYGNLQDEHYFKHYKDKIKEWLKVKPEYDSLEYTRDNLCIINMRGGEYVSSQELYLKRHYWKNAISNMKKVREDMEFMIITEDIDAANRILPEIPAHHFDVGKDYATIKNAKYLILSNSSFAFFPAFTSDTVEMIIAPKYWARHNISNGYWSSEQNIYCGWTYQDKKGKLFTDEQCRNELSVYKNQKKAFPNTNAGKSKLIIKFLHSRDQIIYYMNKIQAKLT